MVKPGRVQATEKTRGVRLDCLAPQSLLGRTRRSGRPVAFLGSLLGLTARQRRFVRFALPFVQRRSPELYVLAFSGRNGLVIRGVPNFPQETSDMADHGDHS